MYSVTVDGYIQRLKS